MFSMTVGSGASVTPPIGTDYQLPDTKNHFSKTERKNNTQNY